MPTKPKKQKTTASNHRLEQMSARAQVKQALRCIRLHEQATALTTWGYEVGLLQYPKDHPRHRYFEDDPGPSVGSDETTGAQA